MLAAAVLAEQPVEVGQQHGRVGGGHGQRGQRVAQLGHGGRRLQPVAGDVTDREQHGAVGHGGRVVPVAADPAGPLGRQVPHRHPQAGQLDRLLRDGQDDLLELGGEAVLGGQALLVLAQLPFHVDEPGARGLPGGHVLEDAEDLQRTAGAVLYRLDDRPHVLDPAAHADPVGDVDRFTVGEGLGGLAD